MSLTSGIAVGIALIKPGGTANGTNWINIDDKGDTLTQSVLDKNYSLSDTIYTFAVGIALIKPGGTANGTNWINIDGKGDALTQNKITKEM